MKAKSLEDKREHEKRVVKLMISLYCRGNHDSRRGELCPDCTALAAYADARVDHCPHMATKTFCSNCRTHCYRADMREKIRAVMRWSGPRMILHHPVMAVRHVIATKKEKRRLRSGQKA